MTVLLIQVTLAKHIRLKLFNFRRDLRICEKRLPILQLLLRHKPFTQRIKVILCKIDPICWRHVHNHNVIFLFFLDRFSLLIRSFGSILCRTIPFGLVESNSIWDGDFALDHLLDLVVSESVDLHWRKLWTFILMEGRWDMKLGFRS